MSSPFLSGFRLLGDVLEVGGPTVNGQKTTTVAIPPRKPFFAPPFNIVRASHVELGVRDLARTRAFYVDCLGLLATDETSDALYLRGVEERNHHSVVLRVAREPTVAALGFKLASEDDLDRATAWFRARN